jgi:hypothetical protein
MIGWFLKNFVQEVPEQLSVCEFDCTNHECTIRDWAACKLHQQAQSQEITARRVPVPMADVGPTVLPPASRLELIAD